MDDPIALHLEPLAGKVLEVRGMGKVHEDLVVKLSQVIDGLVERDVQGLSPAHCLVKSDPDEKGGFTDAVAGNDDSDVPAAKSAVDRVFEQSQRAAFVEFLAIHDVLLVYSSSSATKPVPYFLTSSR